MGPFLFPLLFVLCGLAEPDALACVDLMYASLVAGVAMCSLGQILQTEPLLSGVCHTGAAACALWQVSRASLRACQTPERRDLRRPRRGVRLIHRFYGACRTVAKPKRSKTQLRLNTTSYKE